MSWITVDLEQELKTFIGHNLLFSGDAFDYADDASFLKEGIIDSLGVMDLVMFVHARFSIEVETSDITPENFDSITSLAAFVRRKQAGSARP